MNRTKQWPFVLVGVLFLVATTYFAQVYIAAKQVGTTLQYFAPTQNQEIALKFILIVVVMLVGTTSSYLFEKAKTAPDGTINLRAEMSKMMSSSKFIMALVVSPLIFNSVYLVIGDNPQSIGDYLLAFQNGFFWESVIGGVIKAQRTAS
jgi:hypothetical protein